MKLLRETDWVPTPFEKELLNCVEELTTTCEQSVTEALSRLFRQTDMLWQQNCLS